ncbi:RND family efflux transporter, MFP subunit [Neorhodopirellula lusitana]|uniref:RND family efflux transporter, MFP subunit n=1 Tax=Neorhodopirellula lusitana TaxID=445327 RepID=A0ABY1QQT2_9BACT|nr:efflux RND transporter periplasmic adaptor subunit [Neorhodopirellula lusitana]SMP76127.1 RND family efflux transporter, MFP subunit [Neorhodopirellula lusitana]
MNIKTLFLLSECDSRDAVACASFTRPGRDSKGIVARFVALRHGFAAVPIALTLFALPASAIEVETFTQPYRSVNVAAAEMGVIDELLVKEGDVVKRSQTVAKLDESVLQASLKVAEATMKATSRERTAESEVSLCQQQLQSYRQLHDAGNATQREVDRAENNYWQAMTRLQSVREEMEIRKLEHDRIVTQIQQRSVDSPLDGVVVAIAKEAGEFVSPTDPVLMQIVVLDQLRAVFSVPMSMVEPLRQDQEITVRVGHNNKSVAAVIETVSPVVNAESASVRVTIRLENAKRELRSGVVCRWDLDDSHLSGADSRIKTARVPAGGRAESRQSNPRSSAR